MSARNWIIVAAVGAAWLLGKKRAAVAVTGTTDADTSDNWLQAWSGK